MKWMIGSCLLALCASTAFALPGIPKLLPAAIEGDKDAEAFGKMFGELEMKCSVCHIPGADKKAKGHGLNDFGQEMHKHFDDKKFKTEIEAKDEAGATKTLKAGWAKALEAKNADGATYGSLIKEGKLPSKNEKK